MVILLLIISDVYIESRPVHGYPIPTETADPVILGRLVERVPPVYSFFLFQNFFVLFYCNFIIEKKAFV